MSPKNIFHTKLEESESISNIFELVKDAVRISIKRSRSGLMLGMTELGWNENGFVGAFYPVGSNIIIMNKTPLRSIEQASPKLYKPYIFHVLLHEYLHTLGILDENIVRFISTEISKRIFGEDHVVTQISQDFSKFVPNVIYSNLDFEPHTGEIELVDNFDKSNVTYIA